MTSPTAMRPERIADESRGCLKLVRDSFEPVLTRLGKTGPDMASQKLTLRTEKKLDIQKKKRATRSDNLTKHVTCQRQHLPFQIKKGEERTDGTLPPF